MDSLSLTAVADEQLARVRQSNSGRSAQTIYGGHEHFLRQTVIAVVAGRELGDRCDQCARRCRVPEFVDEPHASNPLLAQAISDSLKASISC